MKTDKKIDYEKAFQTLKEESGLSEETKLEIQNRILAAGRTETQNNTDSSRYVKIRKFIVTYPWRFALSVSAAQAVLFTIIFGTRYTNFFLEVFGG